MVFKSYPGSEGVKYLLVWWRTCVSSTQRSFSKINSASDLLQPVLLTYKLFSVCENLWLHFFNTEMAPELQRAFLLFHSLSGTSGTKSLFTVSFTVRDIRDKEPFYCFIHCQGHQGQRGFLSFHSLSGTKSIFTVSFTVRDVRDKVTLKTDTSVHNSQLLKRKETLSHRNRGIEPTSDCLPANGSP